MRGCNNRPFPLGRYAHVFSCSMLHARVPGHACMLSYNIFDQSSHIFNFELILVHIFNIIHDLDRENILHRLRFVSGLYSDINMRYCLIFKLIFEYELVYRFLYNIKVT